MQIKTKTVARKHPANLRAAGRPPLDGETKTIHQVRLTAAQVETARRLGDGNVSAGIRRALSPTETPEITGPAGTSR